MNSVVQLEAFEAPIKHRRLRWFLIPDSPITYPPGFQEQILTESPPFQRKLLVLTPQSSEAWKLVDKWDGIFVPQTGLEWSLLVTYVQNIPAPAFIVFAPEVQVPLAFYQKLSQLGQKTPTTIALQTLGQSSVQPLVTYDATFFPPAHPMEEYTEQTTGILQTLLSSETLRNFVLRDALRDLKGAGATLVVSSIEESTASIYWYYASEPQTPGKRLLETVLQTLLKRPM